MENSSRPSIEILLRVEGGPAIKPDGAGSYRCEGVVKLDSEKFGPSAIRAYPIPIAEEDELLSTDEIGPIFVNSLYGRMRAAGAEPDEETPLAFVCQDIMAAENTALDFLSLAFGDQIRIELWQIDPRGDPTLVRCGPLVDDPKEGELGAVFRFGFTSDIAVEVGESSTGFQERDEVASGRIPYFAVALSEAAFAEIDQSLPLFVGPLPGARLDAIATLLGERFRNGLTHYGVSDGTPIHAWRESNGEIPGFGRESIPIFEISFATSAPLPGEHAIEDAIFMAGLGRGSVATGRREEDAIAKAARLFDSKVIAPRITEKTQDSPPSVRKSGPSC